MQFSKFRHIKSPAALATFGAFFVPEPLGACFVVAAAIWWSFRRLGAERFHALLARFQVGPFRRARDARGNTEPTIKAQSAGA